MESIHDSLTDSNYDQIPNIPDEPRILNIPSSKNYISSMLKEATTNKKNEEESYSEILKKYRFSPNKFKTRTKKKRYSSPTLQLDMERHSSTREFDLKMLVKNLDFNFEERKLKQTVFYLNGINKLKEK